MRYRVKKADIKYLISQIYCKFAKNNFFKGGILCYHSISDSKNKYMQSLGVKTFDEHIKYLKSRYEIISLHDYIKLIVKGLSDQLNNKVVITFDDGYLDNFTKAANILCDNDIPSIFFLNSNFIKGKFRFTSDKDYRAMTPKQVEELSNNSLFDIGGHTADHYQVSKINSKDLFEVQIVDDKKYLETLIGKKVNFFAYPNGQGSDISKNVVFFLKKIGYKAACSTFFSNKNNNKDLYTLNRLMVWPEMKVSELEMCLSGKLNYIYWIHSIKSYINYKKNNELIWKM